MAPGENKPLIGSVNHGPLVSEYTTTAEVIRSSTQTKAQIVAFAAGLPVPLTINSGDTRDDMIAKLTEHLDANALGATIASDGPMECVPLPHPPPVTMSELTGESWALSVEATAFREALNNAKAPYPRDFTLNGVQYHQETVDDALVPIAMAFEEPDGPVDPIPMLTVVEQAQALAAQFTESRLTKKQLETFAESLPKMIGLSTEDTREKIIQHLASWMMVNRFSVEFTESGPQRVPAQPVSDPHNIFPPPDEVIAEFEALDAATPYPWIVVMSGIRYVKDGPGEEIVGCLVTEENVQSDMLLQDMMAKRFGTGQHTQPVKDDDQADWVPLVRIAIPGMRGSGLRALEGMMRSSFNSASNYLCTGGGGAWEIHGAVERADECVVDARAVLRDSYGFVTNPGQFIKRVAPTVAEQEVTRAAENAAPHVART